MKRLLDNIYAYKTELMGLAILMIVLFHSGTGGFYVYELNGLLELGVDVFLFLGGVTCCKSNAYYISKGGKRTYYKRRVWRVVPPFLILNTFIYGYEYLIVEGDLVSFVENFTFWTNIADNSLRNWYIPAIIIMYLILPYYDSCCRKSPSCLWLVPILLIIVISVLEITNWLSCVPFYMFWIRLPIFLLGIGLYSQTDKSVDLDGRCIFITALLSFCLAWYCSYHSYITLRRLSYIPIVIAIVYFYNIFKISIFKKLFAFLGVFTLEIYLLHEYVTSVIHTITPAWHPTALGLVLGVSLAYIYHIVLNKLVYWFRRLDLPVFLSKVLNLHHERKKQFYRRELDKVLQ